MNKVILMGRLTRDPEIRYGGADNQTAIARFSLAVDRRFRRSGDSVEADFFDCSAFGKLAEFVERYLKQGTKVVLTGRIENNNYTNREGQKVYSTRIVAEELEFAESKAASDRYNGSQGAAPSAPAPSYAAPAPAQAAPAPVSGSADGDFINIPEGLDEELPFK